MFEDITPESIKAEILADITHADTREGSYTNDVVSAAALEIWKVYQALNALIPIAFVDETSGRYIAQEASKYGIIPKAGTKATATMNFTGTDGTVIPKDKVFLTADGLQFTTDSTVTISGGVASVTVTAAEVGGSYNVAAGMITQQFVNISGLTSAVNDAAIGGTDPESDASLLARLNLHRQKPVASGNIYHYEQWALEVDGVGGAKVVPLWDGPGTIKVLLVGPDKGPVDATVVEACEEHIEESRPIGPSITVLSATELAIDIAASITVDETITKEEVEDIFKARLTTYLASIAFKKYEIVYNRIVYMLMDIEGVVDYSSLTINSGTANVEIDPDEIPVVGTVVIN